MARTRKPQLVATARNIARSVPDRIVAIAFLDGRDGGDPELLDLTDEDLTLSSADLDGQEATTLSSKPVPSS
jgi:hypothetical protein